MRDPFLALSLATPVRNSSIQLLEGDLGTGLLFRRVAMHVATRYCATRSELEDQALDLSAELMGLIVRLCSLVGKNHPEFLATRISCANLRKQISESRNRLEKHRTAHGC